ncbi:MAG: Lrp/AsnC family transcriptional regulator [Candidatus Methylomirabilales bacterium]
MDILDRKLLNLLQWEFPLVPRPFQVLAEKLETTEDDILSRSRRLKAEAKIIRQISAIFDTRSLGYQSSLVAMRVDPSRVEEAAAVVNTHPGVSHNYKRDHPFNLWFTIAVPPQSSLEHTVDRLHQLAKAESTRILPTLRLFKIGVRLDMTGQEDNTAPTDQAYSEEVRQGAMKHPLTSFEIQAIRELQEDLPLEPYPFKSMADRLGLDDEGLLAIAQALQERGQMRRFAAVLHHRQAGFRANAMGVWKVPEDRAAEVGPFMGSFRGVSHCYLRPVYPDWPYNIFTMIHGQKAKDCQAVIEKIAETTGITDYAVLYSTKEYKKTRVRYFTEVLDAWEKRYLET